MRQEFFYTSAGKRSSLFSPSAKNIVPSRSVCPPGKASRDAATQRRPAKSKRNDSTFPRHDSPYGGKAKRSHQKMLSGAADASQRQLAGRAPQSGTGQEHMVSARRPARPAFPAWDQGKDMGLSAQRGPLPAPWPSTLTSPPAFRRERAGRGDSVMLERGLRRCSPHGQAHEIPGRGSGPMAARPRTASSDAAPWPHRSASPARADPRSACGRAPSRPGC